MPQTVRAYTLSDLNQMTEIWNEVVRAGNAFPQENPLTLKEAEAFFRRLRPDTSVCRADGAFGRTCR